MIFGPKTLYTTNEILDSILSTGDIKDTTGAVSITKKDGRKTVATGKIFFRNELIYAVEISNREIPIGKRVESGGLVDQDDLEGIFRRVGSKSSPRIVDQLLVGQLISEKNINGYVKEHFIETLGEILAWENCSGEWHPNVTTNDFVMPHVSLEKIRAILDNRLSLKKDFSVAVRSFFKQDEIGRLTFISSTQNHADYPAEIRALLRRADGEFTVEDIARDTGISNFAVFQSVISLWKKNLVTLRLGGIDLSFTSLQQAVQPAAEEVKPLIEDSFVPLASQNEPVGEEAIDPEEESIKEAEEVTKEFVNNTNDYVDEPEETVNTPESDETSNEVNDEEVTVEENETFIEDSDDHNDNSVNEYDDPSVEEETDVDDFITENDISDEPVAEEVNDEFIVSEDDTDIFSDDEVEPVAVSANDESTEFEEESAEDFIPHFHHLPAPVHSIQTQEDDANETEEFFEETSPELTVEIIDEPAEENFHAPVVETEDATGNDNDSAVDINPEPVIETKKEETVPTPANLSETTLTIATFTQRLNELQADLGQIATSITDSKTNLETYEDNVAKAERNLQEAQLAVEAAQADYEAAHAQVEESEEKYSETVRDIETLIQSFKFNP